MSSVAQLPEIDGFHAEPAPARKTRGIYVGFATMVTVALVLAGWYVGERILAASAQTTLETSQVVSVPSVTPMENTGRAEAHQLVLLPLTEYFLQIAALGTAQDAKFLKRLETKGFKARLEIADGGGQILVGPFADQIELARARARLASEGILATETIR